MAQGVFGRLDFPVYRSIVQPVGGKTLVNFPTIFYAHAHPFTETVTIAGQPVGLSAHTSRFTRHVPGGPTHHLPTGVDRTGPSTPLHVSEAVPVLSGYGH